MPIKTRIWVCAGAVTLALSGAIAATAQDVRQQDVSVQLQAGLESAAPTVVYFGFDKALLSDEAQAVLDQQALWLVANPTAKVDLAGHTDAVGSNTYNDALAMRRARAVEDYLLTRGVGAEQMRSVVSRGEDDLAVATERRERLNRRVRTSVTGLVEVRIAQPEPATVTPPPVRTYAESPLAACAGDARVLVGMERTPLRDALESRLQTAAAFYGSASGQGDLEGRFYQAAFSKAECGIAIGYLKKGIRDERSIANCDCFDAGSR